MTHRYLTPRFFLTIMAVASSIAGFAVFGSAKPAASSDNYSPKNEAQAQDEKGWTENLRQNVDKAIDIMKIIKEDIGELDEEGSDKSKSAEEKTPPKPKSWGEDMRNKVDKAIKVMKVIKEDMGDIEKLDKKKYGDAEEGGDLK
ncbi:MAG: hypothetical protein A2Z72_01780 [Omnitrophica bacterium RBG_13_46_9]|nr:MAG: hypothetical protein A2Z72_01780 [Omnitrophica bacterium RBG_13_46_9]